MSDAIFLGGPNDGQTFTHDNPSSIEIAEIDGDWLRIHFYVATDEHKTVYAWRGVRYSVDLPEARDDRRRQVIDDA